MMNPEPYDCEQAIAECRLAMTRTDPMTLSMVQLAESYERHMAHRFAAEEWPILVRAMLLSTASLGAIPHLMTKASGTAVVGAAASTTNVVLNVQAIAAVLLQDRIEAAAVEARMGIRS